MAITVDEIYGVDHYAEGVWFASHGVVLVSDMDSVDRADNTLEETEEPVDSDGL